MKKPFLSRFKNITYDSFAWRWLNIQSNLGLASNTLDAYGRSINDFLNFCNSMAFSQTQTTKEQISCYVRDLAERPNIRAVKTRNYEFPISGLANATLLQRLTAIRLYFDFLIEIGVRFDNPVGRGRFTPGKGFGGQRERGLIPRFKKLPWIPNDEQWKSILEAVKTEPIRNRMMFALSYDAALRREELCALEIDCFDPSQRLIRIKAETTKNRQERVVPYSKATETLYSLYLKDRHKLSKMRGPLFLSESPRNKAKPISIWTWSKVVKAISTRSGVLQLTPHTLRHLCLTDLARANWNIHDIAKFAGHKNLETTMQYIHLSGRELAEKFKKGMASIHLWRTQMMTDIFYD